MRMWRYCFAYLIILSTCYLLYIYMKSTCYFVMIAKLFLVYLTFSWIKYTYNLSFIIDQFLHSFIIHSPIILSWNMIFKSFKKYNIAPSFHCTIASLLFSSLSTGRVTMGSLTCFPTNMAMIHQQHISNIMFVK
jgi:hypothetical protein